MNSQFRTFLSLFLCALAAEGKDSRIYASAKYDPGCQDIFGTHAAELEEHGDTTMPNLIVHPNDANAPGAKGMPLVQATDPKHPATDHLFSIRASWELKKHKRNFLLIVEDMENGYKNYVDYVVPNVAKLLSKFRQLKLPVVWTNWVRRSWDGYYGAVDRFYGPCGIEEEMNPCYIYGENGTQTVDELFPQTEEEKSRLIESLHLNKFADLDEEGREILFPMLQAWGVNTIVLAGAWTDDCIAATAFDAVDRYGIDLVIVNDGMATATIHGHKMLEVMCAAIAKCHSSDEIVAHLDAHPELIDQPKDILWGSVYKKYAVPSTHMVPEKEEL